MYVNVCMRETQTDRQNIVVRFDFNYRDLPPISGVSDL